MTETHVKTVRTCLQQVLKLSDAEAAAITEQTSAAQLSQWTSTAHVELVFAIERAFDVMFDADEIAELASVPAIVAAVKRKKTSL